MIDIKKVFIDTSPFIYFIEGNSELSFSARDLFLKLINSNTEMITSAFTDIEYKTKPKKNSEYKIIQIYDMFKEEFGIKTMYLTPKSSEIATDIRANNKDIKLIDALQLAIAIENNCNTFITNDKQLKKFKGLDVVLLN